MTFSTYITSVGPAIKRHTVVGVECQRAGHVVPSSVNNVIGVLACTLDYLSLCLSLSCTQ